MNKLLPRIEELIPYTNKNGTFYQCGFNADFNNLPFINKLQVVNDIVRQSILVNPKPNPNTHSEKLEGDCFTAAVASIEYLKYLNLGKNHRMVVCRGRPYDPQDIVSKHVAVLLEDEKNNTYCFDATPYVASKYGTVDKLNHVNDFYQEYRTISDDAYELLFFLKELQYKASTNTLLAKDVPFYLQVVQEASNYDYLSGFVSQGYLTLSHFFQTKSDTDDLMKKSFEYNPYSRGNPDAIKKIEQKKSLMQKQINIWKLELNDLLLSDKDPKRQLELAQNIYQEMKVMDNSMEKYVDIFGTKMRMTNMTPRFFYENGLNVVMIKPSAYLIGVRATIRERFLKRGQGALFEYFTNLAMPTDVTGIKPMIYSHPFGDTYERSMNGVSDVILLKGNALDLYIKKKQLRKELGKNIQFKEVNWFDNEKILWEPHVTNLVHSTDNPSEASMHFMIGYPEQQVMTRFMYPNPKLEENREM